MTRTIALITLSFLLGGCATAIPMATTAPTSASPRLRNDILNMIAMIENAQAPGCSPRVVDIRSQGVIGGSVQEKWIVESCGKDISYPVTLTPDPKGGTYFGIKTPDKGARD